MKRAGTGGKKNLRWGFTFLLLFISSVRVFAQTCVQPPPGIIAWWPFDETSGTTVNDIVGNNPGIQVNGPVPTPGQVGAALHFNGADNYVGIGDSDLWAFGTKDFTIEFWAYFDEVPFGSDLFHPRFMFIGNDEGPFDVNKWILSLNGNYLYLILAGPSVNQGHQFFPLAPFSPNANQWYHIALTRNGSTYSVFVDGDIKGSAINTEVIPNPNGPLTIGQAENLGYMHGLLDEMTIYSRALPQVELQAIVNASSAEKCKVLEIQTKSTLTVKLDDPFSLQLQAKSGQPPYSWALVDGTLPTGLDLSPDGIISGTPTQAEEFTFTIKVTDSENAVAEKTFTWTVGVTLPPPKIRINKVGTPPVPGRFVDYFIVLENTSSVDATDLVVGETPFPPGSTQFIDANPAPDLVDGSDLFWTVPNLSAGSSIIIQYKIRLDPLLPIGVATGGRSFWDFVCENTGGNIRKRGEEIRDLLDAGCTALPGVDCELAVSECLACSLQCASLAPTCKAALTCPNEPPPCRDGWGCDDKTTQGAVDPNEKIVIAKKFIQPDQLLVYPVHFENIGTIEARDVFVTDVLDSNLDTSTLQILTPGGSFDATTRTVKWSLLNIDLQPQATGNVLLSIKPKPNLPSGTEIRNSATIQFEVFESLTTNEVVNVIDSTPPSCTVHALPTETSTTSIPIAWSGSDAIGEVDSFSVFVSVDGGSFTPFLERTKDTSATFSGEVGKTYGFLCIAADTAGNVEVQNPVAETVTTLVTATDLTLKKGTLLLDPDPDEDKLTLQGTFTGSAASINPPTEGVKITLTDPDGQIVSLDFPASALWKTHRGPRWTFKDPTHGKTLTIQFNARTGMFSLRVNVRKVNLNDPDAGTLTTSVMIGDNLFQNVQQWRSTARGTKLVTP